MKRLGYDRYVAQGGDRGAVVTDAMARQAPEGLLGVHINVLIQLDRLAEAAGGVRAGTRGARRAQDVHDGRHRLPPGDGHAAADDRLRAAGLTRRPGGLDARPRHGRLLQDRRRLRRRRADRQSHAGPHPRRRHAVLADGHRGLGGPGLLGGRTSTGPLAVEPLRRRPCRSASRRSPARSGLPRAAGSRWSTPTSRTSTRSTRAATSPPGRSRSSSPTEVRAAFRGLR